jgi:uncharacterized membrane protein
VKPFREFMTKALVSGFLIALPVYLTILLILKGVKSLAGLIRPLTFLHPPGLRTEAANDGMAFLVVLIGCFALGVAVLTRPGRAARERIEKSVLAKIPGYLLVRSLTQQLAGQGREEVWKPALAEIEDGLVPAFIIEETGDGRYTVFVPSVPSPVVGSVYILRRERVHPLKTSFAQTVQALSRWGSGTKKLVAEMESEHRHVEPDSRPLTERERTKIA